jgi:hypothetical protein
MAIPLVISGPGNDLDVANVFRSGRSIARHLSYYPSRPPGSPVHELIVGVLDLVGGPLLTNLASVAAAVALLVGLHRLLVGEGLGRGALWGVGLMAANPWFVIAATSTADYVFALAFVVFAALSLRSGRPVAAGVLAAASMGCRVGSGALVAALLLAELIDATPSTGEAPSRRRAAVITAAVAAVGTATVFVPSMLAAHGLSFADNDFSTSSVAVQLGRAAAKDLNLIGPPAAVVALVTVPALIAAFRRWRTSWLVRFASIGFVLSQVLFIRFPWKMAHLLPCLLCLALLLAVALEARPQLLAGLVALQLLCCVVRVNVVQPNDPNQATSGKVGLSVGWGPVITDWRCRRDDPDAYRGRQKVEVEQAWDCAAPFG